jgi:Mlc titration factor MtfA (ptsG expression regulator)
MQINLASVLAAFFLLLALAFGGYDMYHGYEYVPPAYIALSVIAAATIFTMSNQINWWWFTRNPPRLDALGVRIIKAHFPYFNELSETERQRFGSRVFMFLMDKDFVSAGTPDDEVPEDFKVLMAASVVQFTFGLSEYWLPDLEKIIMYPRLFPTVERPAFHACEAHDDNCFIFSGIMLRNGLQNRTAYYNIGLHVAAEYWHLRNAVSLHDLAITDEVVFVQTIEKIRLFKADFWREITGIYPKTQVDLENAQDDEVGLYDKLLDGNMKNEAAMPCFELAVECFFTKPNEMAHALPDTFAALMRILKQDPRKDTYPVLK